MTQNGFKYLKCLLKTTRNSSILCRPPKTEELTLFCSGLEETSQLIHQSPRSFQSTTDNVRRENDAKIVDVYARRRPKLKHNTFLTRRVTHDGREGFVLSPSLSIFHRAPNNCFQAPTPISPPHARARTHLVARRRRIMSRDEFLNRRGDPSPSTKNRAVCDDGT